MTKVIYCKHFPPRGYKIFNFFGLLFVRNTASVVRPHEINHEKIHDAQMKEMLYIFFYLWYGIEYLIVRLFHRKQNDAYHDVSFEEEAYKYQGDFEYLKRRKHFAWVKFLRIKSNG